MSNHDDKLERIVAARMKLRRRFEAQMLASPSLADAQPQGKGPINRHGMPELPPGQHLTKKWPVLDLGVKPEITASDWQLKIDGACSAPRIIRWEELVGPGLGLAQVEDVSDFHCVTTWSKLGIRWCGVRLVDVLALCEPDDDAGFVFFHGSDGYTTNLSIVEAVKSDVLLVFEAEGAALDVEHGGPVRVITPQLYAWKGTKWVSRIEILRENRLGFWERNGYSNTAYPWRNDRYSG